MVTWALVRAVVAALMVLSLTAPGEAILCSKCEADLHTDDRYHSCFVEPPPPEECSDTQNLCLLVRTYSPPGRDYRNLVRVVRTCTHEDRGVECETTTNKHNRVEESCYDTCNWDGCNAAVVTRATLLLLMALSALALAL